MRHAFPLIALAIAVPFFACGGSPPTTHEVTSLPSATASASAGPAVDLSPVAMPDAVVVLIHAAHVSASSDMIAEWAGQPIDVESPLAELVGERIAKLVDLDTSGDMVMIAEDRGARQEPEVRFAIALSVKGFDSAKALLQGEYGLLPLGNGAFEITRTGGHRHEGDSDFRVCALAPSDSGGRIVCSHDATSRDRALPYLTRGLGSLKSVKSDLHVEARPGPFREMVRRERSSIMQSASRFMGGGRDLRAVWESALADLCDGFLDSERATLDANIDAKLGMADLKVTAKGSRGLVTRILTGHPERAEPAPASFLRLPADSDIAFFGHGLDADQLVSPKNEIVKGIDSAMAAGAIPDGNMKDADRKSITDALGHTLDFITVPFVYARGVDIGKALPAVAGLTETSEAAKIRAGLEQAGGWDIIGVEATSDKIVALVKEWTSILARASVVTALKGLDNFPTLKIAGAARNAPPGTVHVTYVKSHDDVEWNATTGKSKKRPPIVLTLHTLIVPDQTRTWIVSALDEATASARARMILANAQTGTLATLAGLDALRAGRLNAGGFVTPRGAGMGLPLSWLLNGNPRYRASTDPLMGISSQSQYTTPLVFTYAESGGSGESAFTFGLRIPRPALADVMQVGPRIFR
jgi:hypothetical protein